MLLSGTAPQRAADVSAATWLEAPHQAWSLWHVRELMPTQVVPRAAAPAPLELEPTETDLRSVPFLALDGSTQLLGDLLDRSHTDAFAVFHDGHLVAEAYAPGGAPHRPHGVLSVTKSVVGCVAAILAERGSLDLEATVDSVVPELGAGGYAGATVRHLLDMRSGVRFSEAYTDPDSEIRRMDAWIAGQDGSTSGLYDFLVTLEAEREHGGVFSYRSCETDVLGWVCERASGARMADLISDLVWGPMGAEYDAELIVDPVGTAVHDGGLGATLRDLVRFGRLLLDGGALPDGTEVVPAAYLRHGWAVDADARQAFVDSDADLAFPGGWYRNQCWFRPGAYGDLLLCLGIHGQLVLVNRRTRTVCVKFSSWPGPQDPNLLEDTIRACDALGGVLAGLEPAHGRHRLPGVVAGSSRGRSGPPDTSGGAAAGGTVGGSLV